MTTYTKDTFKSKHIGRKVKWQWKSNHNDKIYKGIGTLVDRFKVSLLELIEDNIYKAGIGDKWDIDSYELIDEFPMPLKEAYDRGLLKVGQKVRYSNFEGKDTVPCERIIDRITIEGTWDSEGGLHEYADWTVEILEEPKEEENPWKFSYGALEPRFTGIKLNPCFLGECVKIDDFATLQRAILNSNYPQFIPMTNYTANQPTKPKTIMSKVLDVFNALTLSKEDKLLRKLGIQDEQGEYTATGNALLMKILHSKHKDELVKVAEDIDKEIEKE